MAILFFNISFNMFYMLKLTFHFQLLMPYLLASKDQKAPTVIIEHPIEYESIFIDESITKT